MESAEYKTLVTYSSLLVSLLKPCVLEIAEELFGLGIIGNFTREFIRDTHCLDIWKSSKLVSIVQERTKRHRHIFYKFLDVIEQKQYLQDLVSDLKETLCKILVRCIVLCIATG